MRGIVLSGMLLIAATYGLARFGYGLFLPQLREAFVLTAGAAGLVQAGSFLAYCCAAALATRMTDHPRRGTVAAGATAAIGAAGIAIAPGPVVLALSVVVAGAGAGFATPALVALVQRAAQPERSERAQTAVNAGTGAGIVAAAALLVATGDAWRLAWAAIAVVAAAAALAVLLADRRSRRDSGSEPRRAPASGSHRPAFAALVALRPLAAPIAAALLAGASSAAIWTFGGSLLADAAPLGGASAVVAWMLLGAAGIAGAWSARVVQTWSLGAAWSMTTLAMVTATLALGLGAGSAPVALTAAAVFGAAYTAMSGVLIVWAVRLDAARAAQGTVVLFIALAVGQAVGAAAIGGLVDLLSPVPTFAIAAVIGLTAVLPARRAPADAPSASPTARPLRS